LGAAPAGLGPISPELALVDHVLAEQARKLLPEPSERSVLRGTSTPVSAPRTPVVVRTDRVERRWLRTAVLAALVFAAGAASGGFLGRRDEPTSLPRLEAGGGVRPTATGGTLSAGHAVRTVDEQSAPEARRRRRDQRAAPAPQQGRTAASRAWAANVLGVAAGVDSKGVKLVWKRPRSSDHVVVLRRLSSHKSSVVVFHGRATTFRDASVRPCRMFRYTIVNYDRLGHRSTGVPTSVVTHGCA